MEVIGFIIIFTSLLAALSLLYWTIKLGIGPVATSRKVSKTLYKNLPEDISGQIIELGCGWGSLLRILKRKYPDKTIIGYERSPVPRWVASWFSRIPVRGMDFFNADVSEAGLLVCYLYPQAMKRIALELLPKLPSGCLIITHTFALPGTKPEYIWKSQDLYGTPVYLYRKPWGSAGQLDACLFENTSKVSFTP